MQQATGKMRILELTSVVVPLYQRQCRCILRWKKKKERISKARASGKQQAARKECLWVYLVLQLMVYTQLQ